MTLPISPCANICCQLLLCSLGIMWAIGTASQDLRAVCWVLQTGVLMAAVPRGGSSVSSVMQSCPTLRDPMDCSTPGFPVHHQLLEFTHSFPFRRRESRDGSCSGHRSELPFTGRAFMLANQETCEQINQKPRLCDKYSREEFSVPQTT